MAKDAPRLGKGLSALIAPRESRPMARPPTTTADSGPSAGTIQPLAIDAIRPNPRQPRAIFDDESLRALAQSIRTSGLLQPILVRPVGDGRFELIAGERRWRAAGLAGLSVVPAVVRDIRDHESLELALIENLQREDLRPLERARAYQHYLDTFKASPDELARRLAESRPSVVNYLRLLNLRKDVQDLIERGNLGMGQARAIAGLSDPQRQLAIARVAIRRNLSVRQVEDLVRGDTPAPAERGPSSGQRHRSHVEESLSKALGLRVILHAGKRKNTGRVVVHYNSLEEFDRLAERIGGRAALE